MTRTVGAHELRRNLSRLLRQVREEGETLIVTYYGEVIARIIPVSPAAEEARKADPVWTDIDHLAAEIGQRWEPEGASAARAVSEGRRG